MDRRGFLKLAAGTAVGASTLGLAYFFSSTRSTSQLTASTSLVTTRNATSVATSQVSNTIPTLGAQAPRKATRILATADDFDRIWRQVQSDAKAAYFYQRTKRAADGILGDPPDQYKVEGDAGLGHVSDDVFWRVSQLAMAYRLEGENKYAARAWQELQAAAEFPDWNPDEFLSTAMMTHAFAVGYDWIPWTEKQRTILRDAIVEKGLKPALRCYQAKPDYGWWVRADHNWNQVCNGGIGMGAIALLDDLPDLSKQILGYAVKSLRLPMERFAPDGGWPEGPSYWEYGSYYNCAFLASLMNALGTDYGLSAAPGFADTGLFPIYLSGPAGRTFNFADPGGETSDSDHPLHAPHMFWLARRFRQPLYAWYPWKYSAEYWWGLALDLVWFDPDFRDPHAENLPLDKHFRRIEVVTFREAWNDADAVFVAFKAGDNQANHAHLDIGSFVIDALGQRWALDLGADDYNLPGYWENERGGRRWDYYRLRAEGHNTVVVNPSNRPDQNPEANAKIVRYQSKPEKSYAIANLLFPYAGDVLSFQRGIALSDRRNVTVQDEISTVWSSDIWWFMHTMADVRLSDDRRTATLIHDSARLHCSIGSPPEACFALMNAEPLPSSPNPSGQTPNTGIQKLAIHLSGVRMVTLNVLMVPLGVADEPSKSLPNVIPLVQW